MALLDLFTVASLLEVQAKVAQFAATAQLVLTSWYPGAPGEHLYQAFTQALQYYVGGNAPIIRGFFLDTATDPGDEDPYAPGNVNLEPGPGFLSALGENCFFTTRPGATLATTTITFTNLSNVAQTLAPGAVFVARAGYPEITYVTTANADFYTDPGGTRILDAAGGADDVLEVEVAATSPGTGYSASPGEITVLVSGWPSVTVTNDGAATGNDRMSATDYRALCRTQAAATSPNGAPEAYQRLSKLNIDGTPLLNSLGAAVGITKVYVSGSSTTGAVSVYYADGDGAAIAEDVTAANTNIEANVIAVPDCFTFTGAAATEVDITTTWAVKFRSPFRGAAVAGATVKAAINAALVERFEEYPIGGFDQTAGVGSITLNEIEGTVKCAHPAIYSVIMSSPVGTTAIALGHVPHLDAPDGTETATL
jgi:hypothetical protein